MAGIQAFIGSWREIEKTGYDNMADALGLSQEKKDFFKNAKTEITYNNSGDQWTITVGMQGVPQSRTFQFKLGEDYKSESLDGSPLRSVMNAEGKKFVETHIDESLDNLKMNISRHIEGDKMIVVTSVGDLHMQSTYGKL